MSKVIVKAKPSKTGHNQDYNMTIFLDITIMQKDLDNTSV